MDNLMKISSLKVNNMFIIVIAGSFPSCESFQLSCSRNLTLKKFTKNVMFAKHGLNPSFYKVCVCVVCMCVCLCVCVCVCVYGSFINGEVNQYDTSYTQVLI